MHVFYYCCVFLKRHKHTHWYVLFYFALTVPFLGKKNGANKVGRPITCGLKHDLLDLAFKLVMISVPLSFAALPPSSVSSINQLHACVTSRAHLVSPTTQETYSFCSGFHCPALSFRRNVNAAFSEFSSPFSTCPCPHCMHLSFPCLPFVICVSPPDWAPEKHEHFQSL